MRGTEHRSSARVTSAPVHWAASPASHHFQNQTSTVLHTPVFNMLAVSRTCFQTLHWPLQCKRLSCFTFFSKMDTVTSTLGAGDMPVKYEHMVHCWKILVIILTAYSMCTGGFLTSLHLHNTFPMLFHRHFNTAYSRSPRSSDRAGRTFPGRLLKDFSPLCVCVLVEGKKREKEP